MSYIEKFIVLWYTYFGIVYFEVINLAEQIINIDRLEHTIELFGNFDENIKLIETEYNVSVICRGTEIKLCGEMENVMRASRAVSALISMLNKGETISDQSIRYVFSLVNENLEEKIESLSSDCLCITSKGKPIKPKTLGQKEYVKALKENTIVLGVGPAGTGKTYLAVAAAVKAFREHTINRIILTRPAVEAGEKLGFLPGDLQNKVDPYLRPLYDALFDMLGSENFQKYLERGNIEVAPLAYMRGRTLDDSFIILDEAQNTTPAQMKMFLTRIGFGSKVVVTGDASQKDLAAGVQSGLDVAVLRLLKNAVCVTEDTLIIVEATLDRDVKEFEDCGFTVTKEKKYKTNKHVFLRKD